MKITFITDYNYKTFTAMAKVLRKTVRKKHSRRSHIIGWLVVLLGILLIAPIGERTFAIDFRTIVTLLAISAIVLAQLLGDPLNGYIATRHMLKGMERATTVFEEDCYTTTTAVGETKWQYTTILLVAETKEYFVFLFDKNYAQAYPKQMVQGGTIDEFRRLITEKTEKAICQM